MTEHMHTMNLRECPTCRGRRFIDAFGTPMRCNQCKGHGYIPADDQSGQDAPTSEMAKAQKRIEELEAEVQRLREGIVALVEDAKVSRLYSPPAYRKLVEATDRLLDS